MPVILVTGGARGIGAAIVRHFANLNYEILFTYNRSNESALQLESEIKGLTRSQDDANGYQQRRGSSSAFRILQI